MGKLARRQVIDRKEVLENGIIQLRIANIVSDDGVDFSKTYVGRRLIHPGDDVSAESPEIQALCALEHTPEKIAAQEARVAASKAKGVP